MAYYSGVTPQSAYDPTSNAIPFSGASQVGSPTPVPSANGGAQASQVGAPNAVLQNITDNTGSRNTLMGNYNENVGLNRYQQMSNSQPGAFGGGQWTPFGLQSTAQGGGNASQYDYFVHPNAQNLQLGNTYDYLGGAVKQRSNYRDPYTGQIVSYGAPKVNTLQSPVGQSFWSQNPYNSSGSGPSANPSAAISGAFGGGGNGNVADFLSGAAKQFNNIDSHAYADPITQQMNTLFDQYQKNLGQYGQGQFDVNNINPQQVDRQTSLRNWYMSSRPNVGAISVDGGNYSSNNDAFNSWLRYGQSTGMFGGNNPDLQSLYMQYAHNQNPLAMATTGIGQGLRY
jgi:hypothetical protein